MSTSGQDGISIGTVVERTGISASTLRYWESIGLLPAPQRMGGRRRYDAAALRQLEVIALAKQVGFSLAEIRMILDGISTEEPPSKLWRELAKEKLPAVETTLLQAMAMKGVLEAGLTCECIALEDCLGQSTAIVAR